MGKFAAWLKKEILGVLPPTVFFLLLFNLLAVTRAVVLSDHGGISIRFAAATLVALIVAKAIMTVEALPIARRPFSRGLYLVLWKTSLYGVVVLIFRFVETMIHLVREHGGLGSAIEAMWRGISWPYFVLVALWIAGGLFFYCLAAELVRVVGADRVKQALLAKRDGSP